jgi:hypothetical protein
MAKPAKTKKIETNPAASMGDPVLLNADGSVKIVLPEGTADKASHEDFLNGESMADMVTRLVKEGMAQQTANAALDTTLPTFSDEQEELRTKFEADLGDAVIVLAKLFDIDIEQANPDEPPVQYAQGALLRDMCYLSNRNVEYNQSRLAERAATLQRMINRHKGSDEEDVKIQRMTTFMAGLRDQLELWIAFHEAALFAHFSIVGEDWGKKAKHTNVNGVTAASAEATALVQQFLPQKAGSQAVRDKNERVSLEDENETLRKQIDQLSR